MIAKARLPTLLLAALLAGTACQGEDDRQARAAAEQAARAQAAEEMAKAFDAAWEQGNWELARGHGDTLLMEHPESDAAARIKERLEAARARVEEARQLQRAKALWAYGSEPAGRGSQLSAAIYSQEPVKTDDGAARPVRLIFRDHPEWGRSSYLVLERGDFDCYGGCRVQVVVDEGAPRALAASRPKTDEAIAMFIEDEAALWRLAQGARTLSISFPVKAGGTRTAVYEVGGLDAARMPGWARR